MPELRHPEVEVHPDLPAVNMHIGGGDVAHRGARFMVYGFHLLQAQRARPVDAPGPVELVSVREADRVAVVRSEVEVVPAEWVRNPMRNPDHRRAGDVVALPTGEHLRPDDRVQHQADRYGVRTIRRPDGGG